MTTSGSPGQNKQATLAPVLLPAGILASISDFFFLIYRSVLEEKRNAIIQKDARRILGVSPPLPPSQLFNS